MFSFFSTIATILRLVQAINEKVDDLMSQSDEILADAQNLESLATQINAGVTAANAKITDLENQVASGQPITQSDLDALRQAMTDVGNAANSVTAIAPPATPPSA
jgi:peptidoglycan hydrolase CwlO-like protein